jgi:hypothetical protein
VSDIERLVDLLKKADKNTELKCITDYEDAILDNAEFLLDNGIIIAPMPMAEWLRKELTEYVYQRCIDEM